MTITSNPRAALARLLADLEAMYPILSAYQLAHDGALASQVAMGDLLHWARKTKRYPIRQTAKVAVLMMRVAAEPNRDPHQISALEVFERIDEIREMLQQHLKLEGYIEGAQERQVVDIQTAAD